MVQRVKQALGLVLNQWGDRFGSGSLCQPTKAKVGHAHQQREPHGPAAHPLKGPPLAHREQHRNGQGAEHHRAPAALQEHRKEQHRYRKDQRRRPAADDHRQRGRGGQAQKVGVLGARGQGGEGACLAADIQGGVAGPFQPRGLMGREAVEDLVQPDPRRDRGQHHEYGDCRHGGVFASEASAQPEPHQRHEVKQKPGEAHHRSALDRVRGMEHHERHQRGDQLGAAGGGPGLLLQHHAGKERGDQRGRHQQQRVLARRPGLKLHPAAQLTDGHQQRPKPHERDPGAGRCGRGKPCEQQPRDRRGVHAARQAPAQ